MDNSIKEWNENINTTPTLTRNAIITIMVLKRIFLATLSVNGKTLVEGQSTIN